MEVPRYHNYLGKFFRLQRKTHIHTYIFFQEQFYYLVFVVNLRVSKKKSVATFHFQTICFVAHFGLQDTFWYSKAKKYQKTIT